MNTLGHLNTALAFPVLPEKYCGLSVSKLKDISPTAWASSYGHALKFTHHDGQEIGWENTINMGDRIFTRFDQELSKHYPIFSFISFSSKKQSDLKNTRWEKNKGVEGNSKKCLTWLNESDRISCIRSCDKFNAPLSDKAMGINLKLRPLIPLVIAPENFECPSNQQSRTTIRYIT